MKGTSQGKYTKKDELWIDHLSNGDTYIQERTVLVGSSLAFTFLDLTVTSMTPLHGTISGGTPITIILKSDQRKFVSHCWYGDELVKAEAWGEKMNEVTCISPKSKSSRLSIELRINGIDSTSGYHSFKYTDPIEVVRFKLASGSENG